MQKILKVARKKNDKNDVAHHLLQKLQQKQLKWTPEKQKKKSKQTGIESFLIEAFTETMLVHLLEEIFSVSYRTNGMVIDSLKRFSFTNCDWVLIATFEHIPNRWLLKRVKPLVDEPMYHLIHTYLQVKTKGKLKQFLVQLFLQKEIQQLAKDKRILCYDNIDGTCLIAVNGRKQDMVQVKQRLSVDFCQKKIILSLKYGHAKNRRFRFAHYVLQITKEGSLRVEVCSLYLMKQLSLYRSNQHIKPRLQWIHKTDAEIVDCFRREFYAIKKYVERTKQKKWLKTFERCMQVSLFKTLAVKHHLSLKNAYHQFKKKNITIGDTHKQRFYHD